MKSFRITHRTTEGSELNHWVLEIDEHVGKFSTQLIELEI